jgi:hypothetical protein
MAPKEVMSYRVPDGLKMIVRDYPTVKRRHLAGQAQAGQQVGRDVTYSRARALESPRHLVTP